MDVAERVLNRLERIEGLERGRAGRPALLGELRALVGEAEEWARTGAETRPPAITEKVGEGVEGMR